MDVFFDLSRALVQASHRVAWPFVSYLMCTMIIAGGIYPVLYQSQLPHEHIFIGGPPPANWEEHDHENPLNYLLGPAFTTSDRSTDIASPLSSDAADRTGWSDGRVLSVYATSSLNSPVTNVGYTILPPMQLTFAVADRAVRISAAVSISTHQTAERPPTPPPRFPVV